MLAVDVAPGQGARSESGWITVDETPGLGVAPEVARLGAPVAEYAL